MGRVPQYFPTPSRASVPLPKAKNFPSKSQNLPCFPMLPRRRFARQKIASPQKRLWCPKAKSLDQVFQKKSRPYHLSFQRYSTFKANFHPKFLENPGLSPRKFPPSRPISPKLATNLAQLFPFPEHFSFLPHRAGNAPLSTLSQHQQTRIIKKGYKGT